MNEPLHEGFGNLLLQGFTEIDLPEPVSWWPVAPGWQVLAGLLGLLLGITMIRQLLLWRRNGYRRAALRELERLRSQGPEQVDILQRLPALLKITALQAYPRAEVAHLSGGAWLEFLDRQVPGCGFNGQTGRHLLALAHQSRSLWEDQHALHTQLFTACQCWISEHPDQVIGTTDRNVVMTGFIDQGESDRREAGDA